MAEFKGNNEIKSAGSLMYERSQYSLYAFPQNNGLGPQNVLDFNFAERTLYGRIDRQHNAVIPRTDFIFVVRDSNNKNSTVSAMNFVADQFNDFQQHFFRATQMQLIPSGDSVLSEIVINKGYSDPFSEYSDYISGLMTENYETFLEDRTQDVINFEDFMRHFIDFVEHKGPSSPVTFSGFQRSNRSNIFTTGLTIDIAGLPFHNDELTQDVMLDNPAFQFYLNLARQYGFSVSKRNPGVLVSNLYALFEDPEIGMPIRKYRERYPDLGSLDLVFSTQFEKSLFFDLDELRKHLRSYYNSFVNSNRIHNTVYVCGKHNKTQSNIVFRRPVNNLDIYNNDIIKLYIYIRNIEERNPYTKYELNKICESALVVRKISENRMLEQIDNQFSKKFMSKKGTLTHHKKRLRKKLDKRTY